jgi:transposase
MTTKKTSGGNELLSSDSWGYEWSFVVCDVDRHRCYAEGMRYPDGGGLTAGERARREVVRLQAGELFAAGCSGPQVAGRLRVSRMSAWRWQQAWKCGGAEALLSKGSASPCRLDQGQLARLCRIVQDGPGVYGFADQVWTVDRIRAVVADELRVRYSNSGMWRLLDRVGMSWQVPVRRAAERDEAAITTWKESTWPEIKGRRASREPRSASRTKRATAFARPPAAPGDGADALQW